MQLPLSEAKNRLSALLDQPLLFGIQRDYPDRFALFARVPQPTHELSH